MLKDIVLRIRALIRPSKVSRDIDEELRFHVEREAERFVAQGLSRPEAERRAQVEFGGIAQVKQEYREALGVGGIETMFYDLRLAVRRLRKDSRVSAAAVVALALGIGAATVAVGVFDSLLRTPFPYKNAGRLVTFSIRNLTGNGASVGRSFFTPPEMRAFLEQGHVLEEVAASTGFRRVIYQAGGRTHVAPSGAYVSANAFAFYGVPSLIGRGLEPADAAAGAPPVFAVAYRTWQVEFAGDREAVGRTFAVDGVQRTLVGVMPPRFQPGNATLWMPADMSGGTFTLVGRLRPGVAPATAAVDLDAVAHRFTKDEPGFVLNPAQYSLQVTPLADASLGSFKGVLYALLAASFVLLLIACANVANLLLARATVREKEMALCAALGATRARLAGQLFAEGIVLAAAGCALGCACAWGGLKLVAGTIPHDTIPGEAVIALNWRALLGAVVVSAATALLCGLAPAVRALPVDLHRRLGGGVKGAGGGAPRQRVRSALIVAQVSLSTVLLVGGALTMRSFLALTHEALPFDAGRVLYASVLLPKERYYVKPDRKPAFFADVLSRIENMPGVVDASESLMLPPDEGSWTDITIPGKPHTERWTTDMELCTAGYFRTLGIELVKGRLLNDDDVAARRYVAVVNQSLARTYFGTDDPIGQQIKFEVLDRPFVDAPHNTYFEVVGVTADFRTRPGRQRYIFRPTAYLPASVAAFGQPLHILAKTNVDPHALLGTVSRHVLDVEPDAAVLASGSIADALGEEFRGPRFEFMMLGAFGAAGLTLAAIGVFSIMAYTVSLRRYDIGVRLALGADPRGILGMVFRTGAMLILAGMALGLAVGGILARLIDSLLWGVPAGDLWSFGAAACLLTLVGSIACLLPARRAARVDPLIVLKSE